MKPRVYLETTIVSYLTAWPSRDLVMAANQQTTRDWWARHGEDCDLYTSDVVVQEATAGDPDAAQRRLQVLQDLTELAITEHSRALAKRLVEEVPLPRKAQVDALHIAIAAVSGMDYLLTWNCTHIANAALRHRIEAVCRAADYEPPVICTPQELLES